MPAHVLPAPRARLSVCAAHSPSAPDASNIATIYKRLSTRSKLVMWTTTTPVPDVVTSYGRSYALAVEYNAAALAALKPLVPAGSTLLINDLWTDMVTSCGKVRAAVERVMHVQGRALTRVARPPQEYKTCDLQLPANVHLSPAGITFCAESAARDIKAALA